ncbi:C39 family peptidase [Helicobacter sp. 11S03491-1]|uniref:C39 family peptidase n=1 Tax=Helicobacter sp. 11S03491-1 TaxID=1476196 RepID=UPI000BA68D2E|nr:C39 family peptidase [Helicobacter sp. 11S03491-1]PAF42014.1 peptidase C39 [Helicobacter sp. 11S03491-1]
MKKIILIIFRCVWVLNGEVYITEDNIFLQKPLKSWIEFKNDNLVRQQYDYSCGSASIATILKYYYNDGNITERDVIDGILKSKGYDRTQNEVLKEGDNVISFLDLSEYAKSKGFKALGFGVDFESLSKLKIPVIIFVSVRDIDHFSVYKGMDEEYAYLSDPSFGNIKIRLAIFKEMFYQRKDTSYPGKILAIVPQDQDVEINKNFMDIKNNSNFLYDSINRNLIYQGFR